MKQVKSDGTELLSYNYDFDLIGNLTRLENNPSGVTKSIQNYSYDILGRITSSTGNYTEIPSEGSPSYNETYSFDDLNRIHIKVKDGTTYAFSYNSVSHEINNITMTGNITGDIDFDYNEYGNLLQKVTTIGADVDTMTFAYNNADEIKEIGMKNNKELEFTYDNKGQRLTKVLKDNAAVIDSNVYINGFYSKHGENINKHISDGQYIVATLVENNYTNVLYYTQNNIGSTSMLTDIGGNKVQGYMFCPYGEPWITENAESTVTNEITRKFTGQEYDKESELYYMNARYYDPKVGMFLTPDPAMSGLNHYAYCSANPIKYIDPTGLEDGRSASAASSAATSGSMSGMSGGGVGSQGLGFGPGIAGFVSGVLSALQGLIGKESQKNITNNQISPGWVDRMGLESYITRYGLENVHIVSTNPDGLYNLTIDLSYLTAEKSKEVNVAIGKESQQTNKNENQIAINNDRQGGGWVLPTEDNNVFISQDYNGGFSHGGRSNEWGNGIDIACHDPDNDHLIVAGHEGEISWQYDADGYGWHAIITFEIDNIHYRMIEAHFQGNENNMDLPPGVDITRTTVNAGDTIGYMGRTGKGVTGKHLHFEMQISDDGINWTNVNPSQFYTNWSYGYQ